MGIAAAKRHQVTHQGRIGAHLAAVDRVSIAGAEDLQQQAIELILID